MALFSKSVCLILIVWLTDSALTRGHPKKCTSLLCIFENESSHDKNLLDKDVSPELSLIVKRPLSAQEKLELFEPLFRAIYRLVNERDVHLWSLLNEIPNDKDGLEEEDRHAKRLREKTLTVLKDLRSLLVKIRDHENQQNVNDEKPTKHEQLNDLRLLLNLQKEAEKLRSKEEQPILNALREVLGSVSGQASSESSDKLLRIWEEKRQNLRHKLRLLERLLESLYSDSNHEDSIIESAIQRSKAHHEELPNLVVELETLERELKYGNFRIWERRKSKQLQGSKDEKAAKLLELLKLKDEYSNSKIKETNLVNVLKEKEEQNLNEENILTKLQLLMSIAEEKNNEREEKLRETIRKIEAERLKGQSVKEEEDKIRNLLRVLEQNTRKNVVDEEAEILLELKNLLEKRTEEEKLETLLNILQNKEKNLEVKLSDLTVESKEAAVVEEKLTDMLNVLENTEAKRNSEEKDILLHLSQVLETVEKSSKDNSIVKLENRIMEVLNVLSREEQEKESKEHESLIRLGKVLEKDFKMDLEKNKAELNQILNILRKERSKQEEGNRLQVLEKAIESIPERERIEIALVPEKSRIVNRGQQAYLRLKIPNEEGRISTEESKPSTENSNMKESVARSIEPTVNKVKISAQLNENKQGPQYSATTEKISTERHALNTVVKSSPESKIETVTSTEKPETVLEKLETLKSKSEEILPKIGFEKASAIGNTSTNGRNTAESTKASDALKNAAFTNKTEESTTKQSQIQAHVQEESTKPITKVSIKVHQSATPKLEIHTANVAQSSVPNTSAKPSVSIPQIRLTVHEASTNATPVKIETAININKQNEAPFNEIIAILENLKNDRSGEAEISKLEKLLKEILGDHQRLNQLVSFLKENNVKLPTADELKKYISWSQNAVKTTEKAAKESTPAMASVVSTISNTPVNLTSAITKQITGSISKQQLHNGSKANIGLTLDGLTTNEIKSKIDQIIELSEKFAKNEITSSESVTLIELITELQSKPSVWRLVEKQLKAKNVELPNLSILRKIQIPKLSLNIGSKGLRILRSGISSTSNRTQQAANVTLNPIPRVFIHVDQSSAPKLDIHTASVAQSSASNASTKSGLSIPQIRLTVHETSTNGKPGQISTELNLSQQNQADFNEILTILENLKNNRSSEAEISNLKELLKEIHGDHQRLNLLVRFLKEHNVQLPSADELKNYISWSQNSVKSTEAPVKQRTSALTNTFSSMVKGAQNLSSNIIKPLATSLDEQQLHNESKINLGLTLDGLTTNEIKTKIDQLIGLLEKSAKNEITSSERTTLLELINELQSKPSVWRLVEKQLKAKNVKLPSLSTLRKIELPKLSLNIGSKGLRILRSGLSSTSNATQQAANITLNPISKVSINIDQSAAPKLEIHTASVAQSSVPSTSAKSSISIPHLRLTVHEASTNATPVKIETAININKQNEAPFNEIVAILENLKNNRSSEAEISKLEKLLKEIHGDHQRLNQLVSFLKEHNVQLPTADQLKKYISWSQNAVKTTEKADQESTPAVASVVSAISNTPVNFTSGITKGIEGTIGLNLDGLTTNEIKTKIDQLIRLLEKSAKNEITSSERTTLLELITELRSKPSVWRLVEKQLKAKNVELPNLSILRKIQIPKLSLNIGPKGLRILKSGLSSTSNITQKSENVTLNPIPRVFIHVDQSSAPKLDIHTASVAQSSASNASTKSGLSIPQIRLTVHETSTNGKPGQISTELNLSQQNQADFNEILTILENLKNNRSSEAEISNLKELLKEIHGDHQRLNLLVRFLKEPNVQLPTADELKNYISWNENIAKGGKMTSAVPDIAKASLNVTSFRSSHHNNSSVKIDGLSMNEIRAKIGEIVNIIKVWRNGTLQPSQVRQLRSLILELQTKPTVWRLVQRALANEKVNLADIEALTNFELNLPHLSINVVETGNNTYIISNSSDIQTAIRLLVEVNKNASDAKAVEELRTILLKIVQNPGELLALTNILKTEKIAIPSREDLLKILNLKTSSNQTMKKLDITNQEINALNTLIESLKLTGASEDQIDALEHVLDKLKNEKLEITLPEKETTIVNKTLSDQAKSQNELLSAINKLF